MRVGLALAVLLLVLTGSATLFAFSSGGGDDVQPRTRQETLPSLTTEQAAPETLPSSPQATEAQTPDVAPEEPAKPQTKDDQGCVTEQESGPGYNRTVVRCRQEVASAPQSSGPAWPQTVPDAAPAPIQPQTAPLNPIPGEADQPCVTEKESGDGWNRTTVRCVRQSVTAGSSTSSSSVTTSSSVSVSSSTSGGTP